MKVHIIISVPLDVESDSHFLLNLHLYRKHFIDMASSMNMPVEEFACKVLEANVCKRWKLLQEYYTAKNPELLPMFVDLLQDAEKCASQKGKRLF